MGFLIDKIKKLFPGRNDDQSTRYFKIIIFVMLGILVFTIAASTVSFLIVLRGAEEVMIPDVTDQRLEQAVIELQERGINTRIQLKFSSNPSDKGTVIEQSPKPGTIRKAGSNVVLKVSKGTVIDKIDDYRGWKLTDLETHFKSLFTTYGPLLKIKDPVTRIYNEKEEGTILEQKPEPGTELTGFTELELVVSRGPEGKTYIVPEFEDYDFQSALKKLAGYNLPFLFTYREAKRHEKKGVVISQTPDKEAHVPHGTIVQLQITQPESVKGKVFGLIERTLPDYPVSIELKLERITVEGSIEEIIRMRHRGGVIAIPYFEDEGNILILTAMDNEIARFTVK